MLKSKIQVQLEFQQLSSRQVTSPAHPTFSVLLSSALEDLSIQVSTYSSPNTQHIPTSQK